MNYWIHDTIDKFRNIDKTYVPGSYKTFDANGQPYEKDSLDINAKDLFYLRKPVFDHAYRHQEHIDDLKVYKSQTDRNTYIIKGKKSKSGFKFNPQ